MPSGYPVSDVLQFDTSVFARDVARAETRMNRARRDLLVRARKGHKRAIAALWALYRCRLLPAGGNHASVTP